LGKTERDVCLRTRGVENEEEQRREDLSRGKEHKNKKIEEKRRTITSLSLSLSLEATPPP
jgi:hypothetical protein